MFQHQLEIVQRQCDVTAGLNDLGTTGLKNRSAIVTSVIGTETATATERDRARENGIDLAVLLGTEIVNMIVVVSGTHATEMLVETVIGIGIGIEISLVRGRGIDHAIGTEIVTESGIASVAAGTVDAAEAAVRNPTWQRKRQRSIPGSRVS